MPHEHKAPSDREKIRLGGGKSPNPARVSLRGLEEQPGKTGMGIPLTEKQLRNPKRHEAVFSSHIQRFLKTGEEPTLPQGWRAKRYIASGVGGSKTERVIISGAYKSWGRTREVQHMFDSSGNLVAY